jgi:saccharopine dehydrogenase-like NADP-dependent oxidoreductase
VRVAITGFGAVGRRVCEMLVADPAVDSMVVVHREPRRVVSLLKGWGDGIEVRRGFVDDLPKADLTVVAVPSGERRAVATALENGSHVVCATDEPSEVRALLGYDAQARERGLTVAVGTTMAPGLSCLLASNLRRHFDRVEEVHVSSLGTGGPACARRHHSALTAIAVDYEDGEWRRRPGGSGRELVWFPEPVGGADCYRAALADPFLLVPAFPGCRRVTSRMEATRRDRLTSWVPMMRPPHPEGLVGAVRVEVRGWINGRAETKILGAAVAPALAAASVSAEAARWVLAGGGMASGAGGLAVLVDAPGRFLRDLAARGVVVSEFEGTPALDGEPPGGD